VRQLHEPNVIADMTRPHHDQQMKKYTSLKDFQRMVIFSYSVLSTSDLRQVGVFSYSVLSTSDLRQVGVFSYSVLSTSDLRQVGGVLFYQLLQFPPRI